MVVRTLDDLARFPTSRLLVRTKFSASQFTPELQRYRVTVVQYIGEILRYAVAQAERDRSVRSATAPSPQEGEPRSWIVPVGFGNGLRPDIWDTAKTVLGIDRMVEFYASTEGNIGLINCFDAYHAIGHLPVFPQPFTFMSPIYLRRFPMVVVLYDEEAERPLRDKRGFCLRAPLGTPGEIIGCVLQGFDPAGVRRFDGYHDAVETHKKLLKDCFRHGDAYFRSGDLVRVDSRGFVHFVDRVGDTFRWKGENVSTLEVANAINRARGSTVRVEDAVVYAVAISGMEGKAGMAKLKLISCETQTPVASREQDEFLARELYTLLSDGNRESALPLYSIPRFVRVDEEAPCVNDGSPTSRRGTSPIEDRSGMTATFKHRKVSLVQDGYLINTAPKHGPRSQTSDRPACRVYVLVPQALAACAGFTVEAPYSYVELNDSTYPNITGESFERCRW
jgi:acyl-CoA synthetase (AMP-forming)/AMP-acid ligase II